MYLLRGIPISRGIAIANILIRYDVTKMIRFYRVEESEKETEIQRYLQTIEEVLKEIQFIKDNKANPISADNEKILDYYILLLKDEFFQKTIVQRIQSDNYPPDAALVFELDIIKKQFEKLQGEYFQSRFLDFKALADRIIRKMYGEGVYAREMLIVRRLLEEELLDGAVDHVWGLRVWIGASASAGS